MVSPIKLPTPEIRPEKISAYLWGVFFICFLANVSGGLVSTLTSVYLPVIVRDLSPPIEESGLNQVSAYINALYILGWAIGGISWGVLGDRIGRPKSLALSLGTIGIFTLLIRYAPSWELVVAFRLLAGFGVGGILVISTTLLSETWPLASRSIIIGIVSIGFPVGIFSSGLINYMISDWRQAFLIGLPPLLLALASIAFIKESDLWKTHKDSSKPVLDLIIKDSKVNLIKGGVIFGCMIVGLWSVFSWLPTWLQEIISDSDGHQERGLAMMILGTGGVAGGFLSGWVSNTVGVKKTMMVCFGGCFVLAILMFGFTKSFTTLIYVKIAFLALFFGISQGSLSHYVPQLFPVTIRASATGLCFNMGRFVTAIAVFFLGSLVLFFGGYGNALLFFSLTYLIGFLFVYFSKNQST